MFLLEINEEFHSLAEIKVKLVSECRMKTPSNYEYKRTIQILFDLSLYSQRQVSFFGVRAFNELPAQSEAKGGHLTLLRGSRRANSVWGLILFLLSMVSCRLLPVMTGEENDVEHITMAPEINPAETSSYTQAEWWRPQSGLTWQWDLSEDEVDTSVVADVYDIDLYASQAVIDELHRLGRKVICYISVGSWEDWRPDAGKFPVEVLGKNYEGWPGEKWLDIRRMDLLAPILQARLDLCASKGFDGIEPDNMEIYTEDTGFPLTYQDQLRFAQWLAKEAHNRGLAIGVKNAPDQVKDLVDLFDFAITEDCFYYDWCEEMLPFIQNGKPVFSAEYTDLPGDFDAFCIRAKVMGFSLILKKRILGSWLETCPR